MNVLDSVAHKKEGCYRLKNAKGHVHTRRACDSCEAEETERVMI